MFWFHSFISSLPVFLGPLVEETVISLLYMFTSFVKDKVSIDAWIYLWAFYLVPLIYISLCQYHTVLMTVALQCSLKSGRLIPPVPFFFYQD